ncbi:30S ribosomal protein S27ae [Candidatus Micrarchaeota archaeon]|nr:30S ribosomal protein S27ae [Candidatus Micrarchaeota archaeon]
MAEKPAPKKDEKKDVKKKTEKVTKPYKPGKNCPKCGPGVRLAEHKDRRSCGKCGYFEKK